MQTKTEQVYVSAKLPQGLTMAQRAVFAALVEVGLIKLN